MVTELRVNIETMWEMHEWILLVFFFRTQVRKAKWVQTRRAVGVVKINTSGGIVKVNTFWVRMTDDTKNLLKLRLNRKKVFQWVF
jgi:hypothetical protein